MEGIADPRSANGLQQKKVEFSRQQLSQVMTQIIAKFVQL